MTKRVRAKFPTSFGVFSPTGYVVMAFENDASAEKAEKALIGDGFSEDDITQYNKDDVLLEARKSAEESANPVQIGQDVAKIEEYRDLAEQGCGFLIVHAPEELRARHAVAIVHKFGLKFAEKYNRLTLEELA